MIRRLFLAFALLVTNPVYAEDNTIRPVARGDLNSSDAARQSRPQARKALVSRNVSLPLLQVAPVMRPVSRPFLRPDLERSAATQPQRRAEKNLFAFSPTAPAFSLRPSGRSAAFIQVMVDRKAAIQRGQVCGDPAIQGEVIGRVEGRGRCGIENAVRVKSVAGITIQPPARLDCPTAAALKTWVNDGVIPATDGQAASLRNVSDYSCRFRNSAASGKLSEHSFGRAIDIAGVGLKDGREITLLTGWNSQRDSAALRRMWRAACGPFGTVLGPESNRFHRDHFHFDTARYRSGSYCR